MMFIWCSHDVHMMFTWCSCVSGYSFVCFFFRRVIRVVQEKMYRTFPQLIGKPCLFRKDALFKYHRERRCQMIWCSHKPSLDFCLVISKLTWKKCVQLLRETDYLISQFERFGPHLEILHVSRLGSQSGASETDVSFRICTDVAEINISIYRSSFCGIFRVKTVAASLRWSLKPTWHRHLTAAHLSLQW